MKTYIALFRGINVGGNNILPMKDVTQILNELGADNVRTYIQSGNVVFQHAARSRTKLKDQIRSAVEASHNFKPQLLLLDGGDLAAAVENNPYSTDIGKALQFYFLESAPKQPDLEKMRDLQSNTEQFTLTDKVCYLSAPDGVGRSKLAAKIEQCLGVPATARNWNTVSKLMQMTHVE